MHVQLLNQLFLCQVGVFTQIPYSPIIQTPSLPATVFVLPILSYYIHDIRQCGGVYPLRFEGG